MDDQFDQVELAFDIVLNTLGVSNINQDFYHLLSFQLVYGLEEVFPIEW
jgi:hypothetical protein